jgi:hypothetical protein
MESLLLDVARTAAHPRPCPAITEAVLPETRASSTRRIRGALIVLLWRAAASAAVTWRRHPKACSPHIGSRDIRLTAWSSTWTAHSLDPKNPADQLTTCC